MSTGFCRFSFTHLCRSPVRISFRSPIHGPLSFTGSQFLCRSPVTEPTSLVSTHTVSLTSPRTCLAHQSAFPFVHWSTHICRSPFRLSCIGCPFLCHSTAAPPPPFPFVHGSTDLSLSPLPTSSVLLRFPLLLLFSSSQ
jgi:hypothetical protein